MQYLMTIMSVWVTPTITIHIYLIILNEFREINAINQKITNINIILNPEIMMHEFNFSSRSTRN